MADPYHRNPWLDRFNVPSVESLRKTFAADERRLFDQMRKRLLDLDEIDECFVWYGDSWHWTIEYRVDHADEPLAVLIPSPTDPQMAMPLDRELSGALADQRLRRAVRDGLELAQEPFDTRWGIWSLQAGGLIDELQSLADFKLQFLARKVG